MCNNQLTTSATVAASSTTNVIRNLVRQIMYMSSSFTVYIPALNAHNYHMWSVWVKYVLKVKKYEDIVFGDDSL